MTGGMQPPGRGNQQVGGTGQPPTGGQGGGPTGQQGQGQGGNQQNGQQPGAMPGTGTPPGGMGENGMPGGGGGGMGGLLNGSSVSAKAKELLKKNAGDYTWAAAATGSQNAAGYQLATGEPVMAIGGFNGSDPSPTLAQFKKYVKDGRIHYFVSGGMGGMGGDSDTSATISSWVEDTFERVTVGSATFYDLARPIG